MHTRTLLMNVRDEEHKRGNSNGALIKLINSSATSQYVVLRSGGRRRETVHKHHATKQGTTRTQKQARKRLKTTNTRNKLLYQ